ncbi:condensation domain-containing protein, partial [Gilvimarinus sp. SDUM040013]
MDLERAGLLQVQLAQNTKDGSYFVVLLVHHIVFDHIALETLQHELRNILHGSIDELGNPVAYRNYIANIRRLENERDDQAFFTEMLSAVFHPTLPFGLGASQRRSSLSVHRADVPSALADSIREIGRRSNVTVATIFHAAWSLVVASSSNRKDIVFGTVLSGRLQAQSGSDSAVGLFINTLPLRVQLTDQTSIDWV